jgi:hypothetical protein
MSLSSVMTAKLELLRHLATSSCIPAQSDLNLSRPLRRRLTLDLFDTDALSDFVAEILNEQAWDWV